MAAALSLCRGCLLHITSDLINPSLRGYSFRTLGAAVLSRLVGAVVGWSVGSVRAVFRAGVVAAHYSGFLRVSFLRCCTRTVAVCSMSVLVGVSVDALRFSWLCVSILRFGRSALVC